MSRIKLKSLLPLLEEGYHPPGHAETWLMDVYALYALWWAIGSGKEKYASQAGKSTDDYNPTIVNNKRQSRIDEMFHEAVRSFSKEIYQALTHACYDELENVVDNSLIPPNELARWLKTEPEELRREFKFVPDHGNGENDEFRLGAFEGFFGRIGWRNIVKVFNAPFWGKYADAFGGPAWAKISQCTVELLDAIKNGDEKDIMHALDKVIDLHHNTGSILNKNKVGKMAVSQDILNVRARLRSVNDFLPYVSDQVKHLIIGSKNYLNEEILNEWLLKSHQALQG